MSIWLSVRLRHSFSFEVGSSWNSACRTSRHPGRFSYYILIHSYDSFMSLNVLEKICLFVMLHLFPHWNIILLTQCMVCLMIINVSMVHKIIAKHTTILEHRNINYLIFVNNRILGRSLMIGWRKKSWNPERVPSVFTFVSVCLCVCRRTTEHTFWHRNLIFELNDP